MRSLRLRIILEGTGNNTIFSNCREVFTGQSGGFARPVPMAGVSDWTRARQQQRLDDVVGPEASATRPTSDAGSAGADPLGASQQTLVVCSVLQVSGRRLCLRPQTLNPKP